MIVSDRSWYIPEIKGVILIDCWDVSKESIKCFYYNLVQDAKRHKIEIIVNAMTKSDRYLIDANIKEQLFEGRTVLNIDNMREFEQYISSNTKAPKHWYMAGQSWDMCVHDNDVGLRNLAKLTCRHPVDFYATDKSFLQINGKEVFHDEFKRDRLHWKFLNWFGYQLEGNCANVNSY